jgi:hypothetical protein
LSHWQQVNLIASAVCYVLCMNEMTEDETGVDSGKDSSLWVQMSVGHEETLWAVV